MDQPAHTRTAHTERLTRECLKLLDRFRADDRVFRNRKAQGISKRMHERLWEHVRAELAFAEAMGAATHCLRKTASTAVERHAGTAVSDAFLRHTAPTLNGVYTGASLEEVAQAVADLTGEAHPLAVRRPQPAVTSPLLPE